ncbi:pentatricopeptide repeat-containing protein, partial [Trifolium medium]|nr:pentatricopeptide repeat-containing protein [Trifolium medium]
MLLEIAENAAMDIVEENKLTSLVALARSNNFTDSQKMKETISMLPPKFKGGEVLLVERIWNSLNQEFAQQGRCVEVFEYFRSLRGLVWMCSRIFMSLYIACVDPPVFSNGKEMNRYVMRSLFDTYNWLATTFVEVLVQCWDTMMRSLEIMKSGFAFETMSQYAFMQWDPGVTNILKLMLINAHE